MAFSSSLVAATAAKEETHLGLPFSIKRAKFYKINSPKKKEKICKLAILSQGEISQSIKTTASIPASPMVQKATLVLARGRRQTTELHDGDNAISI